jgi:hypothetical protein
MTIQKIENKTFDAERALYHLCDAEVNGCIFVGPADGESALKEARDIHVSDSRFLLRYPLWHVSGLTVQHSEFGATARAALWYTNHGVITECTLDGIKAVRECRELKLKNCRIASEEFGWKCDGITLEDAEIASEYLFLDSRNICLHKVQMKGKYSFQYTDHLEIDDSVLDTKDAFWHSKNATVRDSIIKGEYLGWYSDGLTLINCKIIGTQPLCYCTNLTLQNCTMEACDLSFEYSDVTADIRGNVDSVKNPRSGDIVADSIGKIIREDAVMGCNAAVLVRGESF